jgi:hypothetical protein
MDTRQLVLITDDEPSRDWRLDDHTRQVGLQGIASAREALRAANARRRDAGDHRDEGHESHAA